MKRTYKQTDLRRVIRKLGMPVVLFGFLAGYIVVMGKTGSCAACVAVTDFLFGPKAEASVTGMQADPDSAWSFPTLEGGTFHSGELSGDVTVLTFWATWCPPCRQEIPALNALHERYGDKGVNVIGVSLDEGSSEELTAKVKRLGVEYPVLRAGEDVGIPELFGEIRSIPTVFIFDRNQNIVFREVGYVSERVLEKSLQKVL